GGSWKEAPYMFASLDDTSWPFDRSEINGFRCARYATPLADELLAPVENVLRDYSKEAPVGDEIFRVYRSFYSYDRADLKAAVEKVDDPAQHWRRETVTFNAAYDGERVIAHFFLPRDAAPPYQTVIYFPSAVSLYATSSEELEL